MISPASRLASAEDLVRGALGQEKNLAECRLLRAVLVELLLEGSDLPVESRASPELGLVPYGDGRDEPIDVAGLVAAEASTERRASELAEKWIHLPRLGHSPTLQRNVTE